MITIYGIPNCDTVKKALLWFKENKIKTAFYNYKISGISKQVLVEWCKLQGWQTLLNKKSTTWRKLTNAEQEKITGEKEAIVLMLTNTSIIKRPVIAFNKKIIVGFDETIYQQTFKK